MASNRKKKSRGGLELYVTWMLGALLLLIANRTIFKRMDASVGEPWLNLFLSAIILVLLARIGLLFQRLQREIKWSNSRIDRIDGGSDEEFASYMQEVYRKQGWNSEPYLPLSPEGGSPGGTAFLMSRGDRRVAAAFLVGRRKLTREYVSASAARIRSIWAGSGCEVWLVTNSSFTSQAAREASKLGVKLTDRKALISFLAETALPAADMPARRRRAAE